MATIDRSGAEALIPEDVASEIFKQVSEGSAIMRTARKLPNGSRKQKRLPVLSGLVSAGFGPGGGVGADLYDDIFAPGGVLDLVEEDGFEVTGHIGALKLRSKLRGLRDTQERPLFLQSVQQPGQFVLDGADIFFPRNGAAGPAESLMISGDWTKLLWSLRTDITYKLLTQEGIQDTDGSILYNLAQQDMVALRSVMRLGGG